MLAIHHTIREVAIDGAFVNATIARWHAPTSAFSWITCGEQHPLLITERGELRTLESETYKSLGLGPAKRSFTVTRRRLAPGERLLLVSDGVLGRRTRDGGTFGTDGVRAAIRGVADAAPAETVRALEDAVMASSADRLEDDATIVVLAPTSPR